MDLCSGALSFAKVIADGDAEGGLFLDRFPTKAEAASIRRYCGIPKRREVSEAELDRLRSVGFALRRAA